MEKTAETEHTEQTTQRVRINKCSLSGAIILVVALLLLFLTSISLPRLSGLDIVRVQVTGGLDALKGNSSERAELRLGIWAQCVSADNIGRICSKTEHGYSTGLSNPDFTKSIILGPAWTRGLAIHPVAAGMTFSAFILSLFPHATISLAASLTAYLAALTATIAFACDIALLVKLKHVAADLGTGGIVRAGPGFGLTFLSIILLLISGCTVCCGRGRILDANPATRRRTHRRTLQLR